MLISRFWGVSLISIVAPKVSGRWGAATVCAACLFGAHHGASAQSITALGVLPNAAYSYGSRPAVGGVASTGWSLTPSGGRAYRWTSSTGMVNLGVFNNSAQSFAGQVSHDGSVVVGESNYAGPGPGPKHAFRWNATDGMVSLGTLPGGNTSTARAVSGDGLVVAGEANDSTGSMRAFRWTAASGMVDLGVLPGGTEAYAYGVNADGTVVVGVTYFGSDQNTFATRWVVGQPPQSLGRIAGGTTSFAVGVSDDGGTVAGRSTNSAGRNLAFRWTVDGGMQILGTLPGGQWSEGYEISGDGSVISGRSDSSNGLQQMVWTVNDGMVDLNTYFSTRGLNLAGWELHSGIVGPDGRTFGGHGRRDGIVQAYVATIPPPICRPDFDDSGFLDIQDIFQFLNAWFQGDLRCDVNGLPGLSIGDVFFFLDLWFAGC